MSMADDHTLRSHRSNDPHRRGVQASPDERAIASDPLAELARLLGQSDPFAEFGCNNSRQAQHESNASPPAPTQDDWQYAQPSEQPHHSHGIRAREIARTGGEHSPAHQSYGRGRRSESHFPQEDARPGAEQYEQQPDRRMRAGGQQHRQEADYYYEDDTPLSPEEDAMYDDAPQTRRYGGLATALALVGCAMLGSVGAYAYRSYYSHSDQVQTPPVITADNSSPTKIVPTTAVDPQSLVQDRRTTSKKEQLVTKQEEPVALKEVGTPAAPRVVLPAPVAPAQAAPVPWGSAPTPAPGANAPAAGSNEPKRVRTLTIRPDGNDPSGRPVGTLPPMASQPPASANARQITPPAPRAAAPARSGGGPVSLEAQPWPSDPGTAAAGNARVAAAPPPPRTSPESSSAGGFVVQLSSQKTESDARASFRSLQAKFPNELGDRQPIIRRADLGSKGVYYRTMVGPFASVQEASRFCASYKAAGGQCVVPNN
jgi:hypothetical protein